MTDELRGYDPVCRFAKDTTALPLHVCTTRDGEPVHWGQDCFAEARAQLREQKAAS